MDISELSKVIYRCHNTSKRKLIKKSIKVIGLDTESYTTGRCFMICTSLKDVFKPKDFPRCFFSRKYRGKSFVAYNLGYDEGSLIQRLPKKVLKLMREGKRVEHKGYKYFIIPKKMLSISKDKNSIHIYDMYNFYTRSLDYNARIYLNETKREIGTLSFSRDYVRKNFKQIAEYCIQDAVLVQKLAELLIKRFEKFGVYPRKLYSTAYVSYQYFRQKTNYVTVKRFWDDNPKLIYYSMLSYNGGKFEVTEKGTGDFYEYDIISAYPFEIANLVDITYSRVVDSKKYRKSAVYAFLKVRIKIPVEIYSPLALKYHNVNIYPVGVIEKVITKREYDYLTGVGCNIDIIDGVWLHVDQKTYPYKKEIHRLVKMKQEIKKNGDQLDYHTIKIFLNSLYGKFVQLIKKQGYFYASTCWNPIYGSIITSNVRVRVTELQQLYKSIVAVHTDSIISKQKLPFKKEGVLGDLIFECSGKGLIIGSGIYQIGDKVRFRGYSLKIPLIPMVDSKNRYISLKEKRAYSWREVIFHNWDTRLINQFTDITKKVDVNFDRKRLWIDDYKVFREVLKRNVISLPHYVDGLF